jgi:hypothetical protein
MIEREKIIKENKMNPHFLAVFCCFFVFVPDF